MSPTLTFTYDFVNYPQVAQVRLLIMDTDSANPIFMDYEINQFLLMKSSQFIYQSGQANPTGNSIPAPVNVYSIYGAAALALMSMASNKAALSSITKLLDVELDPSRAQKALKAMADGYLTLDDNMGHFAIAEMVNDQFSARERVWKMFLRLYGS